MFGLGRQKPVDPKTLTDVASLAARSRSGLRALGRLSEPLLRRSGEPGFLVASWDEALDRIAAEAMAVDPARAAFCLASSGLTNEIYYAAQKAARFLGTNHVDNVARRVHAVSTAVLEAALGDGAATCSSDDWPRADLIVLFGSDVASDRPAGRQRLRRATASGAQVVCVDTVREPEPQPAHFRLPPIATGIRFEPKSAGRRFTLRAGGIRAFLVGVLRALIEEGGVDEPFVRDRTTGFEEARAGAVRSDWETLEADSGAARERMAAFARLLVACPNTILVWSTDVAQHAGRAETASALVNVALARGLPGRPGSGIVPLSRYAGVRGAADVGCLPALDCASAARFADVWEFPLPGAPGWSASEMIAHAADGDIDLFWIVDGDLSDVPPDAEMSRPDLARVKLRIHEDVALSPSMLAACDGDVLVLPATTRDESEGGGTETSFDRRITFHPGVAGRRSGSARPGWWMFGEAMARARPNRANYIRFDGAAAIRAEIARAVPLYAGIEKLAQKDDQLSTLKFQVSRFAFQVSGPEGEP